MDGFRTDLTTDYTDFADCFEIMIHTNQCELRFPQHLQELCFLCNPRFKS